MRFSLSAFLQWKINIFLYRHIGWSLAFGYILVLGRFYFLIKRNEKVRIKVAVDGAFPEGTPKEKKSVLREVFRGIFFHYYEKLYNVYNPPEKLKAFFDAHMEPRGLGEIRKGLSAGKGVLLITGHFGGIEYIPKYLALLGYPVTILAKFTSVHLRNLSRKQARELGLHLIDPDECPNVIRAVLADLKANRIVITQCDEIEAWRPSASEETVFLGKRIHVDKTLNTLIKRGGPYVLFAVMHRFNRRSYAFIAHPPERWKELTGPISCASPGEQVIKLLERYIYRYPHQWYQWKKVSEMGRLKLRHHPALKDPIPWGVWSKRLPLPRGVSFHVRRTAQRMKTAKA